MKTTDYTSIYSALKTLTADVPFRTANLANASALIYQSIPDINWAGFYFLENDVLILGPFQGKPACISIPLGKGVCGTAALANEPILVDDVHAFPGHIACDSASQAEIVIPLRKDGVTVGVLDIDSPLRNRFTPADKDGLELLCKLIEDIL